MSYPGNKHHKRENRTFPITQQNPYLTALFPQLIYGHVTHLPIPTSFVRTNEPCIVLSNQGSRRL
ncbi:hypothetical protein B0O99DRAFT_640346 [Bisporella sp. PMI_857]|nr:hypothetical protein B0O99DRAFT_640346 [Bisporella sp. PMI_857]